LIVTGLFGSCGACAGAIAEIPASSATAVHRTNCLKPPLAHSAPFSAFPVRLILKMLPLVSS